jgi:hypothetical protein
MNPISGGGMISSYIYVWTLEMLCGRYPLFHIDRREHSCGQQCVLTTTSQNNRDRHHLSKNIAWPLYLSIALILGKLQGTS